MMLTLENEDLKKKPDCEHCSIFTFFVQKRQMQHSGTKTSFIHSDRQVNVRKNVKPLDKKYAVFISHGCWR